MKKQFLFLLIIMLTLNVFAQNDTIYLKNGENIPCEVYKDDGKTVFYYIQYDGYKSSNEVERSNISDVKYEKKPLKTSHLTVGIGFGPSYGIFGTHAILGYNNSGLLIGSGVTLNKKLTATIGAQLAIKWIFANIGFGPVGEVQYEFEPYETIYGLFYNIGVMFNVGKYKRGYIEFEIGGISEGNINNKTNYSNMYIYGTSLLGFGYRFGKN